MKRILTIVFAALLCLACHSEKTCTIRGTVTVPDAAQDYYAVLYQGGSSIDTCLIADGKFTLHAVQTSQQQLRVEIHDAQGKRLNDGSLFDNVIEVIPDTDAIDVNVDTYESNGSPLTEDLHQLIRQINNMLEGPSPDLDEMIAASEAGDAEKMEEISRRTREKMNQLLRETYLAHLNDAVGLQALQLLSFELGTDEFIELVAQGADFIQEDEGIQMTLLWRTASDKESGAVEYVRINKDGSVQSRETKDALECLNSLVGQGQYVLLDFWASWCGPCRNEIPNVIKLYAKYAGKGLKVVGVTVKDKPEASLAAIRELGINYDQIFDLEGIVCGKYPIEGIPHFFLLDPSGKIVLSGHHNLDEFDAYFQKAL